MTFKQAIEKAKQRAKETDCIYFITSSYDEGEESFHARKESQSDFYCDVWEEKAELIVYPDGTIEE